jgi:hypothetical protein
MMRWTSWFLGCWWRQTGLALFARRNVNYIHLLPRYLTVLSIFVCPSRSWTSLRLPVRRRASSGRQDGINHCRS